MSKRPTRKRKSNIPTAQSWITRTRIIPKQGVDGRWYWKAQNRQGQITAEGTKGYANAQATWAGFTAFQKAVASAHMGAPQPLQIAQAVRK